MKTLPALALAATLAIAAPIHAAPKSPATAPLATPFGEWSLDTSRLPIPPEARPKHVTIIFKDAGANRVTTDVDIVYSDGKEVHSINTTPVDGTPTAITGSPEADLASLGRPEANVIVMVLAMGGQPGSTRIFTALADGKTMTETVAAYDKDNRPALRTRYFTRVH
ncbi:hypothetical protein KPL74_15395 [Bacillus sp. NP157]|nr:hypothetical protein KPL74_15395 [Bacillus sp. NP157]